MDTKKEIGSLQRPFQKELDRLYAEIGGDENLNHSSIRSDMLDVVGEEMVILGFLQGVIHGAGISWTLDEIYFIPDKPLSDGRTWVLFALWFDDNENRWQFNDCGCLDLGIVPMATAAYKLLKKFVKPGSDKHSNEDYEDLIEEWRCRSLDLPVPKLSRRDARLIEQLNIREDQRFPNRPSVRDAQFTEGELIAVIHALVMVVKADGVLHKEEATQLNEIASDLLSVNLEWVEKVLNMVTTEAIPLFMFKILGKVKEMREAKKMWLCQYMYMLGMVDGHHDDTEKDVWFTISSAMGMMGPEGVDAFSDVSVLREASQDLEKAWEFAPRWPFMPGRVEVLSRAEGESPIVPVNDQGALIVWMRLEGFAPRLDLRLNYVEDRFILRAECGGVTRTEWMRDFKGQPAFADIIQLLAEPARIRGISRVAAESPLGTLLGGGIDLRNWNPRRVGEASTVTRRIEFDDDNQADGSGVISRLFGKRVRRCLEISSNSYIPPLVMEKFLRGEIPPRFRI